MRKTAVLIPFIASFLLHAACSQDTGETEDVTDGVTDPDTADVADVQDTGEMDRRDIVPPPYEASFLVSELRVGTLHLGFDVDDEDTQCTDGTCIPDGLNGVDNRLEAIFEEIAETGGPFPDVDRELREEIAAGMKLIVFRLTDVNVRPMGAEDAEDSDVRVKVYSGSDADDPDVPEDNFRGNEPLDVTAGSLGTPGDIEDPVIAFRDCTIINGTLLCPPSTFSLDLPMGEGAAHLSIAGARIKATVNVSPEEDWEGVYVYGSMTSGILGGFIGVGDFRNELEARFTDISPATLERILMSHADIDAVPEGPTGVDCDSEDDCMPWQSCSGGSCREPADHFDSISVGFSFKLTSIEFTGTIAG